MTLAELNQLPRLDATAELLRCCGSRRWAERMADARPFSGKDHLFAAARKLWTDLDAADWLEAFSHHPRIGEKELRAKYASTADWATGEQAGAAAASEATLKKLAEGNARYEARFGRVFLVCATGKSADEMLKLLEERLPGEPDEELVIAAGEQAKITRIRLEKLIP